MSLFLKELEELQCNTFSVSECVVKKISGLNLLATYAHNFKIFWCYMIVLVYDLKRFKPFKDIINWDS